MQSKVRICTEGINLIMLEGDQDGNQSLYYSTMDHLYYSDQDVLANLIMGLESNVYTDRLVEDTILRCQGYS